MKSYASSVNPQKRPDGRFFEIVLSSPGGGSEDMIKI